MCHKKKGSALVVVIIVFAILMILGSTVLAISLSDTKQVAYQEKKTKAYYTAYSGADSMASYIISNPAKLSQVLNKPGTSTIGGNTLNVEVKNGATADSIVITASGTGVNITPVYVNLYLKKLLNPAFDYTVFAKDQINIGNNSTVKGNIGTNADSINSRGTIIGNVYTSLNLSPLPADPSLFSYSAGPYKLKDDDILYYKVDNINDSLISSISWDAANHAPGGKAQIHLFAENSMVINNVNLESGITVYLYYNGTNSITDDNGFFGIHHCFIYAPNASFSKNGGGNGTFEGAMIVKSCTLPNSNGNINYDNEIKKDNIVGAQTYVREKWSK